MFGMGFAEILIIAVIAILFLGPDKLPQTMVEIAKFFRSVKRTVSSAKASLDEELHISDMKEEVMNYKKELISASNELDRMVDIQEVNSEIREIKKSVEITEEAEKPAESKPAAPTTPEVITFPKKKKSSDEDGEHA